MMTNTHMLLAGGLVARPGLPRPMLALAWFAGLWPDLSVIVMVAWSRITGVGVGNLWDKRDGLYWQEPWQTFSAISNSMPLYALILAAGIVLWRLGRWRRLSQVLMIFGAATLLHVLCDFPVHTDDAHVHFWPLIDWRFHSPVSYYQRDHFGMWVGLVEMAVGIALAISIWMRYRGWPMRAMATLLTLPYVAGFGFLMFGPRGLFT